MAQMLLKQGRQALQYVKLQYKGIEGSYESEDRSAYYRVLC